MDLAMAADHLTLAAHAVGLGTCWIAWSKMEKAKEALGIPEDVREMAMTPLGYQDESPEGPGRKSLEERVMYDKYR